MSENNEKKGGYQVQISGNINGNALFGDFSGNTGNISSNNSIQINSATEGELSKEEKLKQLVNEFYSLLESSQEISQEAKETSVELVETNQQLIELGQPKKTIIESCMSQLNNLKNQLNVDSPLLTNISSLVQILTFFLPK